MIPLQFNSSRSARSFICAADSSPLMYKTDAPAPAILAAVCKRRVDLPIPGSPPSKIAERFVAPPPRTRSNSPIPVESLVFSCACTVASPTGRCFSTASLPRPAGETLFLSIIISSKEFHSPHSGHLPSQRGCVYPQLLHL